MKKYIDADLLRKEIERNTPFRNRVYIKIILSLIDYLQQKQPVVNLDKEFTSWWLKEKDHDYQVDLLYERYPMVSKKLARHFFELGLNARKEEK